MANDPPTFANLEYLDCLVDPDPAADRIWTPEDLVAMYRHQLASKVWIDLAGLGPAEAMEVEQRCGQMFPPVETFAELLRHPHPDLSVLRWVKVLAKVQLMSPDRSLPRDLFLLLYYLAIVVARLRWNEKISTLPDLVLITSTRDLMGRTWIDEATRGLLSEGLAALESAQA